MKPRIGVTASLSVHDDRAVEGLERSYVNAVMAAGGIPLVLPVADPADLEAVIACVDGILLSGGGDVDPAHYGAPPSVHVAGVEPERDTWELALGRHALLTGTPLLGICRGAQVLNVAAGGTLIDHLPDVTTRPHCQRDRGTELVHAVELQTASGLAGVVGLPMMGVNSLHHQAVRDVGAGLRAVAWADDGVIEAVEGLGLARALGVQWHPELLPGEVAHAALFSWLVEEARRFRPVGGEPERQGPLAPPLSIAAA
jgi:putative glutamine amidotransferase